MIELKVKEHAPYGRGGTIDDYSYDANVARALLQAVEEFGAAYPFEDIKGSYAADWIKTSAAELIEQWKGK